MGYLSNKRKENLEGQADGADLWSVVPRPLLAGWRIPNSVVPQSENSHVVVAGWCQLRSLHQIRESFATTRARRCPWPRWEEEERNSMPARK